MHSRLDLPVVRTHIQCQMKRILVTLVALFLVSTPLMAQKAMGQGGNASHAYSLDEYGKNGNTCPSDHGEDSADDCCLTAVTHCAASALRDHQMNEIVSLSSENVTFEFSNDFRFLLMPESETPPPRF